MDNEEVGRPGRSGNLSGVRPMKAGTLTLVIIVTVLVGLLAGSLAGYLVRGPVSGPTPAGTSYVFLTIGFDFASGLDRYFPANFTVSTHTLVVVTITNYDNASNPVPAAYATVQGTVGNVETMRFASQTTAMAMGTVPATQVAHTFTMASGGYQLNVPIPKGNTLADPTIVTFQAYFNITGNFEWHCMAPCDPSSMGTPGFMEGTVAVVEG